MIRLQSIFSNILAKTDSNEIGLKLLILSLAPFLWRGFTFAIFSCSGKIPVRNDLLIVITILEFMWQDTVSTAIEGISSTPVESVFERPLITLSTSVSVVGNK